MDQHRPRGGGDRRREVLPATTWRAPLLLLLLAIALIAALPVAAAAADRQLLQTNPLVSARPAAYCLAQRQTTTKACKTWENSMCQWLNQTGYKCLAGGGAGESEN